MNVLAAGDDHVLRAPDDPEIALLVDSRQVSAPEPAILRQARFPLPVAAHERRTLDPDLAFDQLYLAMRHRLADAARLAHGVLFEQSDGDWRGLGGARDLAHRHAALVKGANERIGHDHRAAIQWPQAGKIGRGPR